MRTSEVLGGAADLIETHGHWRGQRDCLIESRGGRHCVLTAIATTADNPEMDAAIRGVEKAIGSNWIAGWSDGAPTDEVIAMLRAVAATERARERTEIPPRMLPVVIREAVAA